MQLSGRRRTSFRPWFLLTFLVVTLADRGLRADDHVAIRGQYYRETSTRVVQPVVELSKDLPAGFNVTAGYLLDAITSASAASGPSSDAVFTEYRNEERLAVSKSWDRTSLSLAYRYSAESDYWSHTLSAGASWRLWGDTGTFYVFGGEGWDVVSRRVRGANPMQQRLLCPSGDQAVSCDLDISFGGLSYTQVLAPTWIVQAGYDLAYLSGFQGSPYRVVPQTSGPENVPGKRLRQAATFRAAWYWPAGRLGLQLHYRYYWDTYPGAKPETGDPWQLHSQTVEERVYKELPGHLEARVSFRYYDQSAASFWCDLNLNAGCYAGAFFTTSDPKLGRMHTYYPELKLTWDAVALTGVPFFGWFATGAFDIAYGRYIQSTSFGDAHVVQVGYLMPY